MILWFSFFVRRFIPKAETREEIVSLFDGFLVAVPALLSSLFVVGFVRPVFLRVRFLDEARRLRVDLLELRSLDWRLTLADVEEIELVEGVLDTAGDEGTRFTIETRLSVVFGVSWRRCFVACDVFPLERGELASANIRRRVAEVAVEEVKRERLEPRLYDFGAPVSRSFASSFVPVLHTTSLSGVVVTERAPTSLFGLDQSLFSSPS